MTDGTTQAEAAQLVAVIASTPGVRDALVVVAASYRADAAALGVDMTPGQRAVALGSLAVEVLRVHPGEAQRWGGPGMAVRALVAAMGAMVNPPVVLDDAPGDAGRTH